MKIVKPIKTNKDYYAALGDLEKVFDAKTGSANGDRGEVLMILIQDYERKHYPVDAPSPAEAIKFRMEQLNLKQSDLAKYLGSESRVSEILNGKRSLTIEMVASLHRGLGIPLESLIKSKRTPTRYTTSYHKISIASEGDISYRKTKRK